MGAGVRMATWTVMVAASMALSGCAGSGSEPVVSTPGGADGRSLQARALQEYAEMSGISNPPQVEIVRETSPFDYDQAQVDCLRAAGYDASVDPGGGIQGQANVDNPTQDYWQQFMLASYVCQAQYPLAEIYYEPLTEKQKSAYAEYFLEELPQCLDGFDVQYEDPPSREVFLARFDTEGPWSPYATVQIPPGKTDSVMEACPQFIPPDRLWDRPE